MNRNSYYSLSMAVYEKDLLKQVMEESSWNQSQAARKLGINRATLHKKIKQHGLRRLKAKRLLGKSSNTPLSIATGLLEPL